MPVLLLWFYWFHHSNSKSRFSAWDQRFRKLARGMVKVNLAVVTVSQRLLSAIEIMAVGETVNLG